ncbi:hypothetical protein IGJ01_002273 [Enterococcus sp. AZ089]|uniref:nuclear transport factor 2 family protein n=1 Tax=unclassified Enterococcus TaxID=2608891 RepID=UPI0018841A47|nr:nuclear transport factor 2 family protein [Enterococcus casseliflavus]
MSKNHFLKRFIYSVITQDEAHLKTFFQPEAKIIWPCTSEIMTLTEYLSANCRYPGDWSGQIIKGTWQNDQLIAVSKIWSQETAYYVTSFFTIKAGKIIRLEEYWADISSPPQWRIDLLKHETNKNKSGH